MNLPVSSTLLFCTVILAASGYYLVCWHAFLIALLATFVAAKIGADNAS